MSQTRYLYRITYWFTIRNVPKECMEQKLRLSGYQQLKHRGVFRTVRPYFFLVKGVEHQNELNRSEWWPFAFVWFSNPHLEDTGADYNLHHGARCILKSLPVSAWRRVKHQNEHKQPSLCSFLRSVWCSAWFSRKINQVWQSGPPQNASITLPQKLRF